MATKEKKPVKEHKESDKSEFVKKFRAHPVLYTGALVFLLFTIIAFVFVPAMAPKAGPGTGGKITFGTYDGKSIDFLPGTFFASQVEYYNQQLRSSGQDQNLQFAAFQVWRSAFESTVIRIAVLKEMEDAGYRVPEETLDRKMAEYPAFLENGRFSAIKYRAMSEADRVALREKMREELIVQSYAQDVLDLHISSREKDFMKSIASPVRSFEFVQFPLSSYPESEVAAYIQAKPELFKTIHLSAVSMEGKEDEAKKLYDAVKKKETSFEDAVKKHPSSADLGVKHAYELKNIITDEAARDKVLALEKGAYSDLIKTASGWSFYRCDEALRLPAANDVFTLTKAREYLFTFERGKIEDWVIANADKFCAAATAKGFASAGAQYSLPVKKFGPLPLNYGDSELYPSLAGMRIPELASASKNENFWNLAFSTKTGAVSKPMVVGDAVIVLRVVSEASADISSLQVIDYYYPYVVSQYSDQDVRAFFLGSKKLKDNFYEKFVEIFLPKDK